jgi:hypothetical protein
MRTNVNLDEDAHLFASMYAGAKGVSLSAAVNELIRRAVAAPSPAPAIEHSPNGLPRFPRTGKKLTLKMIQEAEGKID